jgi:hypothetical protein
VDLLLDRIKRRRSRRTLVRCGSAERSARRIVRR